MFSRELNRNKSSRSTLIRGLFLMTFLWCIPMVLSAQEVPLELLKNRARADASYEHQHEWLNEEDEKDYWTDQRNFEKRLKNHFLLGYKLYLSSKRMAYLSQSESCNSKCQHGDYYRLQSSYYLQYGLLSADEEQTLATRISY